MNCSVLLGLVSPIARRLSSPLSFRSRRIFSSICPNSQMGLDNAKLIHEQTRANFRLCNVSGCKTDLLEIHAQNPAFHVLFIPGNPGVVSFYTDFLESLYELLGGNASVTGKICRLQKTGFSAIAHVSHTEKNWESGRLFSLQEQIDHKISFIEQELKEVEMPILLVAVPAPENLSLGTIFNTPPIIFMVGHSIGAYISMEILKRSQGKVTYCVCLYPFLAVNSKSSTQNFIGKLAASPILCIMVSSVLALLGTLPARISRFLAKEFIGKAWSSSAVDALCTHVLQYHAMRNVLFMAMTEFEELSKTPDWAFMMEKKSQISFLFGLDDHWGPLHMFEEISKHVPDAVLAVEREGHSHAFSCTEAGSLWVAQHVTTLIKNHISNSSQ